MNAEFVKTERPGSLVSGIDYGKPVRVLIRSPEVALYIGLGLNAWTNTRSPSMSAVKTIKWGRIKLADMQSDEIRKAITDLFGEGADELAIKAFRTRGPDSLGTVLLDGGGTALDFSPRFESGLKQVDGQWVWEEPVDHPMLRRAFGYETEVVKRRARAWLKVSGVDEWGMMSKLPKAMEAWGFRQPTYREISDAREAKMKAKAAEDWDNNISTRNGFTKEELIHLAEMLDGANHPLSASIGQKAVEWLKRP